MIFVFGLVLGGMFGAAVGYFVCALCVISKESDDTIKNFR